MTPTDEQNRQRAALKAGREAEAAGLPVIYIHGRAYADPASEPPPTEPRESPFPWDLWDA